MCLELPKDEASPGPVAGVDVGQGRFVVAVSAAPWDVAQVDAVVDAVIGERRESMLFDRVPQAKLGGDAVAEPVQDRQAIGTFRRRGQSEQFPRRELVHDDAVRRCRGVVELVDDDHVEVVGRQMLEPPRRQALDRRENVVERRGAQTADPFLAEGVVTHHMAERRHALVEDLLSMRDEE